MFSSPLRQAYYPSHIFTDDSAKAGVPQHTPYLPVLRSPLSPRSANIRYSKLPSPPTSPIAPSEGGRKKEESSPVFGAPFAQPDTRWSKLTIKHKVRDAQTQRRDAIFSRQRQSRNQNRRTARGGDDEMQRRIFLAEQSRWEDRQASMAAQVIPEDLDAEIEQVASETRQSEVEEIDVDEMMRDVEEDMSDYDAFEPMFSPAEPSNPQQSATRQAPAYVQQTDFSSSMGQGSITDPLLDMDMDDFDFDFGEPVQYVGQSEGTGTLQQPQNASNGG